MFRTLNTTMSLGSILCCFGCLFGVYFGAIWGSIWGQVGVNLGSIWGPFGVLRATSTQDPFSTPFWLHFGPLMDPKFAPTWKPWGVLGRSWALVFHIIFPMLCQTLFWIDFGPQSDPKINQNSIKKHAQVKVGKRSHFNCSSIQFWRESDADAKPLCFCTFFQHSFISMKQKNDFNTNEIIIKNPMEKRRFFEQNFNHFGNLFSTAKFFSFGKGLGLDFGFHFGACWLKKPP